MSLEEALEALEGEKGTKVSLKIVHPGGEAESIELTREKFEVPAVDYQLIKNENIAVLDINHFSSETPTKLASYLEDVERYFLETKQSYKRSDLTRLAKNYGYLGNAYADRKSYGKAIQYYGHTREIFEKMSSDKEIFLAQTYDNLGSAYRQKGNPERALKFHEKALEAYRQIRPVEKYELARTRGNIGRSYLEQKNYKKAVLSLKRAEEILSDAPNKERAFLAGSTAT